MSNPNIILQGQPVDTNNILNSFLIGRKIRQEDQAIEKQNKLAEALANTPREKLVDTLYQQGMFKEAQDYSKNQADVAKTEAETGLKQFERKKKMLDASLQLSTGYVNDPMLNKEKIIGGLNSLKEMGLIDESVYMQSQNNIAQLPSDTLSLRQWAKQSMMQLADANKALDMQFPDANAQLQAKNSMDIAKMKDETQRGGQELNYNLGMKRLENDRQKIALTGLKQPQNKLPEGQQKQVVGAKNLHNAINEYLAELKNWKLTDAALPDSRARMGTKYNNMMLQAKEAYNLGVLNGPDFQILQSVVTDPRSLKGVVTSNEALANQAKELDRMMASVADVAGQKVMPGEQSSSWQKPDDWEQFMQEIGGK